jgi:D-glycero-D-manno-heptose 1,7-bisphosphate phosphatase
VKAVFLDKDGTLVVDVPRNVDPERIMLAPGTIEGVAALARSGYRLIVASNQPGVTDQQMRTIEARLWQLGIELHGFYYCAHAVGSGCTCRKPAAGLLQRAARDQGISLAESWMVGDILDDVEAGTRAGCRTVLIDNGNETEWQLSEHRVPDHIARDLAHAADIICGRT